MGRRKKQILVYDGNWKSIILRNSRRQYAHVLNMINRGRHRSMYGLQVQSESSWLSP